MGRSVTGEAAPGYNNAALPNGPGGAEKLFSYPALNGIGNPEKLAFTVF